MPDPLVRLERLSYRYPGRDDPALRDVGFTVSAGELVAVAGRSGCGKSTLLHACCGLVPHYHGGEVRGEIEVGGLDVRDHGPARLGHLVGLVTQDPETQVVASTVRGEIELPLEMQGLGPSARARAVEEVALTLSIPGLLDRTVDALSGGELQRVALGAALVARPPLILLDEPTSQLDPVAGDELVWLLRRLNEEWGTAVVVAEHRLERCLGVADRVVAMDAGRIVFDGPPPQFLEWTVHADAALATPGAELFDRAGLRPLPVGVKEARALLRERRPPAEPLERRGEEPATGGGGLRRSLFGRHTQNALTAADLWVDRDDGATRREVLRGVSLEIEPGERVALMGRNGVGKSTLLRAIAGLLEPVRGRVEAPRGCALLAQSPSDLLVRERVREELPGEAGRSALAAVGMEWAWDADPRDLSGGERQRLALAIVMAGRGAGEALPGLICLDEPTRGMDRRRKDELAAWVGELTGAGAAVLVATHDVELAAALARRVVLLGEGRVIADGPAESILSGGWHFSTQVARILDVDGVITPTQGAALLGDRQPRPGAPAKDAR